MKKIEKSINIGKNVHINPSAQISAKELIINNNVSIAANTEIFAEKIYLGYGTEIKSGTKLGFKEYLSGSKIFIGDHSIIDNNVRASVPILVIGDYGIVHENVAFYGEEPCTIGHNCWIGQYSILNSKARLQIGNNFRIGVQSQVWTHVASGELIEGCKIYNIAPTIIDDDVWLVGHVIISPGIRIAKKTIVLPGAILSKDTEESHCYAGIPSVDITSKYNPYSILTLDEKYDLMIGWINDFLKSNPHYKNYIKVEKKPSNIRTVPKEHVVFSHGIENIDKFKIKGTFFDVYKKQYGKRNSKLEVDIIRYLIGHKARFTPLENHPWMQI